MTLNTPTRVNNPTRMIHAWRDDPTVALCGAKLRGIRHLSISALDCVVCADIEEAMNN
jgi:hypothetical protein